MYLVRRFGLRPKGGTLCTLRDKQLLHRFVLPPRSKLKCIFASWLPLKKTVYLLCDMADSLKKLLSIPFHKFTYMTNNFSGICAVEIHLNDQRHDMQIKFWRTLKSSHNEDTSCLFDCSRFWTHNDKPYYKGTYIWIGSGKLPCIQILCLWSTSTKKILTLFLHSNCLIYSWK